MGRQRISLRPQAQDAALALGAQIRHARERHRLTRDDLAARAGVSPYTVTQIESGAPSVSWGNVLNVAVTAGVPLFGSADAASLALVTRTLQSQAGTTQRVMPRRERKDGDDGLVDF